MIKMIFLFHGQGTTNRKQEQCLILHPKILNLLGIPLCTNQIKLLSKGLKLKPTPRPNIPKIKGDIEDFTRKQRLREFFCR